MNGSAIAAFDSGNPVSVASELRERYKDKAMIVAGDDDNRHENNPGRSKALDTAAAVKGEGRRATLHHGAGGRESRSQCRIVVSVFPEQGGDPLPAPERRMAADDRFAARHPWGRPEIAAWTAAHPSSSLQK